MPTSFLPGPEAGLRAAETHTVRAAVALAALLTTSFVVAHLPFIPATLDGVDSTNFVLAIDRYDPGLHQPHPPGYPVHVAAARLVDAIYRWLIASEIDGEVITAAASLRLWSVIAGALAMFPLMWVALGLGASASRAALVAALALVCPLFWVTGMRPLSDVPGLFFAMLSQALALAAYNQPTPKPNATNGEAGRHENPQLSYGLLGAALIAGLAIGARVQTFWLTVPLLVVVAALRVRRFGMMSIPPIFAAFAIGMLLWMVPLMFAIGGPAEYVRLLTTVASDDLEGVEMLAIDPSVRLLAQALHRTLVVPWGSPVLGWSACAFAALGLVTLARHNRRVLGFIAVMGLPYLSFHLLFQDTASIRYALPLIPVSSLLIVASLKRRATRLAIPIVVLVLASAIMSAEAAIAYGRTESPVARALNDLKQQVSPSRGPFPLAFHHSVGRAIRAETWPGLLLAGPVRHEWLELAEYWLKGGRETVSFLADGRRTDLALIDPVSRTLIRSYHWPPNTEPLLGGIQPAAVDRYDITPPGWFLTRGWAVTPETHGVSRRDGHAPGSTGIVGYVKRRDTAAVMMVGGRNLGGPCDIGATLEVAIDGKRRATWIAPSRTSFLHVISLAAGDLKGDGYAPVTVMARDVAEMARLVDVAIEQFDIQSAGSVVAGFDSGWHMPELDPASGRSWRWTDEVAELRMETFGKGIALVVRGESPLRTFQSPPRVVIKAGDAELASFDPDDDFEWIVDVPAAALRASEGRITIASDRSFIPDAVSGNGDERRLALRIYSVEPRLVR